MRHRLLSILSAAVVLSLAACGDTVDKNAYVKDVTSVQQSTQTDASKISSEIGNAKTPAGIASKLDDLATTVNTNADRLAAIDAPEDVADLHKEYVVLMRTFSTELSDLAARIKSADAEDLGDILTDTSKLTSDLATDEQQIVDKINTALQG